MGNYNKFWTGLFGVFLVALEFAPGGLSWSEVKILAELTGVALGIYVVPNVATRIPAFRKDQ